MESEMRDLTSLLQEISTGPIFNVREVKRLIKGVIHRVLPDDPSQPLSNSPETAVTKGRRKTNSTKRDKSHWEYVQGLILALVEEVGHLVAVGIGAEDVAVVDRVYQPLVVSNFLFGDENHWVEIRRRIIFDLRHHMQVYEQLFRSVERVKELIMQTNWEDGSAPREYWMNTPDHLYVIANTFNLCVVFLVRSQSTTVLPLVSNMDGPSRTIFVGLIEELQHFIQLQLVDGCPLPPLHIQW
ncbi:hypothetical protein M9H77_19180 [Catharanthus roseus]|uniref:Uncharacterized protein n=1 Tax=Catharanthus roseus TaxID=4058 RepID=A0ACC0B9N3_CATRO|nr:hypothetical protein M9H77_19180 [Catharanthus roseus]